MQTNKTKAKLKAGETVFGCFVRYPDATLVEVIGYQGWDFCVFDAEHGVIEPRDVENMVRAAELRDLTPIVRVTTNLPPIILRYMDSGAQGLHVPWINSAAEADAALRIKLMLVGGILWVLPAACLLLAILQWMHRQTQERLLRIEYRLAELMEHPKE